MKRFLACIGAASLALPTSAYAGETTTVPAHTDAPAGEYTLDKSHGSLLFRVNHMGFSHYTARFTRFDAQLHFDPAHPEASSVTASIDPRSLETDYPDKAKLDFNAELLGDKWLDAGKFPQMTYRSMSVEMTGPNSARIHGELTLHGVSRPVDLDAVFNGGYAGQPMDPNPRIGFSAHGALMRSEFGVSYGIPPAGSSMGVSDAVEVIIEAEFTRLPK